MRTHDELANRYELKRYISENAGIDVGSIWDDLPLLLDASERADYPTQKPERLVQRIIRMGSSEGGLVLDPFCGSGTGLVAASKSGRRWIGGDNCPDAISVATHRLQRECHLEIGKDFSSSTEEKLRAGSPAQSISFMRIATGFDDLVHESVRNLVYGKPLEIEETREYEFKEIVQHCPPSSIADAAEKYAVAFLNSEGGRIVWGVRSTDRIVMGVKLTFEERDRLRQAITSKLGAIRPAVDPTSFRVELHPIEHPKGESDLVVIELVVPRVKTSNPYYAGGTTAYVRLDGVTRKLVGPELTEWIVRRMSNI